MKAVRHETRLFFTAHTGERVNLTAAAIHGPALKAILADPKLDAHVGLRDKEPYSEPLDTDLATRWAMALFAAAFLFFATAVYFVVALH